LTPIVQSDSSDEGYSGSESRCADGLIRAFAAGRVVDLAALNRVAR
jgi:hypothetical protein